MKANKAAAKAASQAPVIEASAQQISISSAALQEICVTIHGSLEAAINIMLEEGGDHYRAAAALICPAVERLAAIAEENDFPE